MSWITRHPRTSIIASILAALVALYALAGFFLAPYLLRSQAPERIQAALGVPAELDEVNFNPFTFRLEAKGFRLGPDFKKPLFSFNQAVIDLDAASLFQWAWVFQEISLHGPSLELVLNRDGSLNLPMPARSKQKAAPTTDTKGDDGGVVRFLVREAAIIKGRLTFQDRTGGKPAVVTLSPIDLDLKNLSTMAEYCKLPEECGPFSLSAVTSRDEVLSWRGAVSVVPLSSTGHLAIEQLQLASLWEFAHDALRLKRPQGALNLAADYGLRVGKHGLELGFSKVGLKAWDVAIRPEGGDGEELKLKSLELAGGALDLAARRGSAQSLRLAGVSGRVILDQQGRTAWASLLPAGESGASSRPTAPADPAKPWRFSLGRFSLQGEGLGFADRTLAGKPFQVSLADMGLDLEDVALPQDKPWPFKLKARAESGGALNVAGRLTSLSPELEADYHIQELGLSPLSPYLSLFSRAGLESGALSSQGTFSWDAAGYRLAGGAEISDLSLSEPVTQDELAGLQLLSIAKLKLDAGGLIMDEAELTGPRLKLVIDAQGGTNLAAAFGPPEGAEPKGDALPPESSTDTGENSGAGFEVRLGLLKIMHGSLDFSDLSLEPKFRSLAKELRGAATGLSTRPGQSMSLEVEGRVDQFGAAMIKGSFKPQALGADTKLRVKFDNLDLHHLSPYAVRFAGYRLTKGRLYLDLDYTLQKGRLKGDNQVMAQDLTLGEKVPGAKAPDLPLELAVALLRDSSGQIKLAVPVSGDLNDPNVAIGGLVAKAVTGLITGLVTSPFRLLASLVNAGGDDLDRVGFPPGRATLPPPQEERLTKLGEALGQRPQLRLMVRGGYSPEADAKGLKELALRRELAKSLGRELPPEAERVELNFSGPELVKMVEDFYQRRFGDDALARQKKITQDQLDKLPRGISDQEREKETHRLGLEQTRRMYEQLSAKQDLPKDALAGLAARRAEAVKRYLVAKQGLADERVRVQDPVSVKAGDDGLVPSPMSLEAGG